MVLSEFPAGSEREALRAALTPSLYTGGGLRRLREAADGRRVDVHVKVDTGMHRVGVYPPESLNSYLDQVAEEGFGLDALWTHFADSAEDEATTRRQLERFLGVVERARAGGHAPRMLHAANSGATLLYPGEPSESRPVRDRRDGARAGAGCRRLGRSSPRTHVALGGHP